MERRKLLFFAVIIFFFSSLLITHNILVLTTQRIYSIPSPKGTYDNSSWGGEAFDGEHYTGVHLFPGPGANNVSLDTLICVDQMRPVSVNLQINPEMSFITIKNEHVGVASRVTTFYPSKNLQPNTTYNMSGKIMDLSAWWIFTTGSSINTQIEYEYLIHSDVWGIPILVSSVSSLVIIMIILIKKPKSTN